MTGCSVHKCTNCDRNWPNVAEFQMCPVCDRMCHKTWASTCVSEEEAYDVLRHARFEKYLASDDYHPQDLGPEFDEKVDRLVKASVDGNRNLKAFDEIVKGGGFDSDEQLRIGHLEGILRGRAITSYESGVKGRVISDEISLG